MTNNNDTTTEFRKQRNFDLGGFVDCDNDVD